MTSRTLNRLPSVLMADHRTEAAAARRFVAMHGNDVRYCAPWGKWLIWDGRRWKIDDTCAVEALAKQTADAIWEEVKEALPTADRSTATTLCSFASSVSSANWMRTMLLLARSEPGIPVLPDQLDVHHWLFNCLNYTVDLRTGCGLPHARDHYLTKLCPHEFLPGPEGECPLWELAVDRILGGN